VRRIEFGFLHPFARTARKPLLFIYLDSIYKTHGGIILTDFDCVTNWNSPALAGRILVFHSLMKSSSFYRSTRSYFLFLRVHFIWDWYTRPAQQQWCALLFSSHTTTFIDFLVCRVRFALLDDWFNPLHYFSECEERWIPGMYRTIFFQTDVLCVFFLKSPVKLVSIGAI